LNTKTSSIDPK